MSNHIFSDLLTEIVNLSKTGTSPDLCKLSKIIPIFKNDDPMFCVNHRPNFPGFSKLLMDCYYMHRQTIVPGTGIGNYNTIIIHLCKLANPSPHTIANCRWTCG